MSAEDQQQTEEQEEEYRPLFNNSYELLSEIKTDVDSLYNTCNKVDKISAESLINYHEKSSLKLMGLSVMLEMLESYLEKGR
jgi:hypothetical protein